MTTRSWSYRITRILPLGLVAGLCSLAPAKASSAATWTTTTVDSTGDVGKFASLAADGNNKLHISYFDTAAALKYTTNNSGSWPAQGSAIVPASVTAAGTGITIDAANNPHISYYTSPTNGRGGIRSIDFLNGSWTASGSINGVFAPAPEQTTAIANRDGYSHITYVRNVNGNMASLYYAKNVNANSYASWSFQELDNTHLSGTNSSVAVDSAGKVYIVGYNSASTDLFYYTNESGSWSAYALATSTTEVIGKGCALAIDGANNLHLAYLRSSTAGSMIIYRFKPAGGNWQAPQEIADPGSGGGEPSIAVDATGKAHISFYSTSSGTGKLRYATNLSGNWTDELADLSAANVGRYSSIEVSDNTIFIAYYDVTNGDLKVTSAPILRPLQAKPGSLSFGVVDRGFESEVKSVTVTNNLTEVQTLGDLSIGGSNAGDFALRGDNCSGQMIPAGGSCTISIEFAPPAGAPRSYGRSASLTLPSSAADATLTILAAGTTSDKYLVSASAGNGGSISPTLVAVAPGGSQTFSVTPDPGFSVATVIVDGATSIPHPYTLTNVNADHVVVASLVAPTRILETLILYGSLQSAYGAANDGWTIETQAGTREEDLLLDRNLEVNLFGGYDGSFTDKTGTTAARSLTVSEGTVTLEGMLFQ